MKMLLTASALMLSTNLALAGDFYGGFASPDLESNASNDYGATSGSVPTAPSAVRVSLYDYYQGVPDVPQEYERGSGTASGTSLAQSQATAYDDYVRGDPDIDVGNGAGPVPYAQPHPMIASR